MKILVVAKPWKGGLGRYFFLALQDMFPGQVEWISTRPAPDERSLYRRAPDAWWNKLREKIATTAADAVFVVGYRKEFAALKPRDNYILYLVDDVRLAPGDADAFGRVFLSDPGYEAELRAAIPPEKYGGVLPFAFYPALHNPAAFSGRKRDVCFIGNRDAKRDVWLAELQGRGMQPLVIGNYFLNSKLFWKNPLQFRPAVSNDAMGVIYARHKISLNIHAGVVRAGTNMRSFECAGYGIPQIIEHRPGLEAYFTPEQEILVSRDADEMIAHIHSLLNDPVRAQNMARAAQKRALAEHTYHHRIVTALGHLLPRHSLQETLMKMGHAA